APGSSAATATATLDLNEATHTVLAVHATDAAGGELALDAACGFSRGPLRDWLARPVSVHARCDRWGLHAVGAALGLPLTGTCDGDGNLAGPVDNLNGIIQLRAHELAVGVHEHLAFDLNASVAGQRLQLERLELRGGRDALLVRGDLPWPAVTLGEEVKVTL